MALSLKDVLCSAGLLILAGACSEPSVSVSGPSRATDAAAETILADPPSLQPPQPPLAFITSSDAGAVPEAPTAKRSVRDLYLEAYVDRGRDADSACQKFRKVLEMTEPATELHRKAAAQVAKCDALAP